MSLSEEETEMKKDIEWLKEEINKINPFIEYTWKKKVLNLLDQLDEPEVLSVVEEYPEYVIQSKEDTTLYLEAYELGSGGHENWTNKDNCWWTRDRSKAEAVAYLVDGIVEELEE